MSEVENTTTPSVVGHPCAGCGIEVEQPARGHRKYCLTCRKGMQDKRSRECHSKRRNERTTKGECTQCGTIKGVGDKPDVPLAEFWRV